MTSGERAHSLRRSADRPERVEPLWEGKGGPREESASTDNDIGPKGAVVLKESATTFDPVSIRGQSTLKFASKPHMNSRGSYRILCTQEHSWAGSESVAPPTDAEAAPVEFPVYRDSSAGVTSFTVRSRLNSF